MNDKEISDFTRKFNVMKIGIRSKGTPEWKFPRLEGLRYRYMTAKDDGSCTEISSQYWWVALLSCNRRLYIIKWHCCVKFVNIDKLSTKYYNAKFKCNLQKICPEKFAILLLSRKRFTIYSKVWKEGYCHKMCIWSGRLLWTELFFFYKEFHLENNPHDPDSRETQYLLKILLHCQETNNMYVQNKKSRK